MLSSLSSSTGNLSVSDTPLEDEEVFEITDFTNASDWEKFISQIEETITDWQLNHYIKFNPLSPNELTNREWEILTSSAE